ncbi:MAG: type II toxin-antitoxin system MqsA family antitoxin [Rubellimicrobium sp.]|nr:type II toxin-antitoxin system MqsA family antitoxin [Rubellimicrobium sp.]
MSDASRTRHHPETGTLLVRGTRPFTVAYRGQSMVVDMPGWYAPDDPAGESGLHDARDMRVSDRALNTLKALDAGLFPPDMVRKIRKGLRITQREAGALIGGGPNAFQKYESGDIVISKAVDTALRLLDGKPQRLSELRQARRA